MRKTSFKTLLRFHYSQLFVQYGAAFIFALGVLSFRLSQLMPGVTNAERNTFDASQNLTIIRNNPVNLPYKLLILTIQKVQPHNVTDLRLASVGIGIIALGVFFVVVRRWFGFWISALTTFLLLTSSWFLHITRQATPDVGQLALIVLLGFGLWLKSGRWPYFALIIGTLLIVMGLYTPGVIWLILIGIIYQRKYIKDTIADSRWLLPLGLLVFGTLLIPLIWQATQTPKILLTVLSIPSSLHAFLDIGHHLLRIPVQLFWHGPSDPSIWLPGTPLLDYMTAALALIGLYSYAQHHQLDRSRMTLSFLAAGIALVGITGSSLLGFILPSIYLLVAAGLAFMVRQWITVFPRNPFARGLMVGLILIAVSSISYYQLSHYFLAWARHPETRQTFKQY